MTARAAAKRARGQGTLLVRRVCWGVMLLAVAEFLIATIGVQIRTLPNSTDLATYYLAGKLTAEHRSPYDRDALAALGHEQGFSFDQFPFLYPPPFALAMQPLAKLSYSRARQVWMLTATLCLLAALVVTGRLVRALAARIGVESDATVWLVLAVFVFATLNSSSVHNDIRGGSVGCLLFLCMALVARESLLPPGVPARGASRRSDVVLALALVVAALAKLVPFVLVGLVAWRGRHRAALLAIGILALLMVASVVHWGPGVFTEYVREGLLPSARAEVAPPMNQSMDAALSRIFVPTQWVQAPLDLPVVKLVLSVIASLAVGLATLRTLARRHPGSLAPLEVGYVVLAVLLLMKLTWVQTLAAMLFVWPVTTVLALRGLERGARWARPVTVIASAAFFLSSAHLPIMWEGLRHGPLVLFTWGHVVGVLGSWAVAGWLLRHANESDVLVPGQ